MPVAALIACNSASTAPSPVPSPDTLSPSGVVTVTFATGGLPDASRSSNAARLAGLGLLANLVGDNCFEIQRGHRCFFVASSLRRLKAVFKAWPSTRTPSSSEGVAQRVPAGVLAQHDEFVCSPTVVASMIS